jgi:hypothetical protein
MLSGKPVWAKAAGAAASRAVRQNSVLAFMGTSPFQSNSGGSERTTQGLRDWMQRLENKSASLSDRQRQRSTELKGIKSDHIGISRYKKNRYPAARNL